VGDEEGPMVARRILGTPNLAALARKPVLIELLLAALDETGGGALRSSAQVYLYATNALLLRNIETKRTFTSTADKLFFLCELAWEMIRGDNLRIHYKQIPEWIKAWFGEKVADEELDHWDYDLRNQTLLQRTAAGEYEFAHKSLAEYFVAYKFAAELGCLATEFAQAYREADGTPCNPAMWKSRVDYLAETFGMSLLTPEVREFMIGMVGDGAPLWEVIEEARAHRHITFNYAGSNAATILAQAGESFAGLDLTNISLRGADFTNANLSECKLSRASLRGALLVNADLSRADLRDTTLCHTNLVNATLIEADLRGADLTEVYITEMTAVKCVAWSQDGHYLASSGDDADVRIWDFESWHEAMILGGHSTRVTDVCWSPQGRYLASEDTVCMKIWDTRAAQEVLSSEEQYSYIRRLCYTPDGNALISGGGDTIVARNSNSGAVFFSLEHPQVFSLCCTSDGRYLIAGGEIVAVWDIRNREKVLSWSEGHGFLTFASCSPNGKSIAVGGSELRVLSRKTGRQTAMMQSRFGGFSCVTYSPDGKFIIAGTIHGDIKIWYPRRKRALATLKGHAKYINSVSCSPDGRYLASGSDDATIRIWDADPKSPTFGRCLHVLESKMRCEGMRISGAKGLDQPAPDGKGTLREWLRERGAVE